MQIKLTYNSDTNASLTVSADSETLQKIKDSVLKKLNTESLKIPGFRAGHAPLNLVEKNVDQGLLQSEFIDAALNHYYQSAIRQQNLRTAGQPTVDLKKFVPFTDMEFVVTVDVLGKVTLPDYKKVKQTPVKVSVTTKDVNEVIASLRKRLAEKTAVERPAQKGDEVVLDFKGVDDKGQAVNGAEGKDYPLILGSDSFIPGFEENVVGIKAGEEKTFTIPFPKTYAVTALQGKKVTFAITVKKVNELIEPKADDAFAAKAGPFKTLQDLKADIKKQLLVERQAEADRIYDNELLQSLAKKTKVAIPAGIIDEQVQRLEEEERRNLTYRGQTWQEHLEAEGVTEEEHRQRNRPDAEEQIKIGVMLGAIGDAEDIEVTPEELEIRMQLLKGQYQDSAMQAQLDKPEARQDAAARIRTEKIIAKLREYAQK
jgi:trigger factor